MKPRISIKVTGAQGQGVNSVGELVAKGLKRSGYCVFGYREYMSLIKGGHSSYQLDVSNDEIRSTETKVDLLVNFNHHGLEKNWSDVKPGGVILHQTPMWKFKPSIQKQLDADKITVIYLPVEDILRQLKFRPILGNMLITSVVWGLLGRGSEALRELIVEQFGRKGKNIIDMNYRCVEEGIRFKREYAKGIAIKLPRAKPVWKDSMLLTGSQALGLGVIHAGCRVYVGYPMTPSSPLLSYIAGQQNQSGMVIKQAEDEINAAGMMSGAMFMGTRAMTCTSGGGFDLMTETLSLNGIIENPSVFGLAMRPGPATGLPTWTGQGDLHLAVHAAHGEFPRCVISVSDSQDAFDLMPDVFNIAEEYQISVIFMYDKQIGEAIYTQPQYNQKKAKINRGSQTVTDTKKLAALKATDRFKPTVKSGISPRWYPGSKAETYCGQGDEHNPEGLVDETAENAIQQMDKRMRKMALLKSKLPDPELFMAGGSGAKLVSSNPQLDLLLVGWGSTKGPVLDALEAYQKKTKKKIGYLHYTYMWPLRTERFAQLAKKAKRVVDIEGNFQGQLAMLLQQESCIPLEKKILKYDGRPFFTDETIALIQPYVR